MKPFKMFFGIAIAIIVFSFVIRVAFTAFIIAAVMSIVYAIYRRVKDFITYDRFGEYYINGREYQPKMQRQSSQEVEPLFYETAQRQTVKNNTQFFETY
jgi:hypothetical protein